MATKVDLGNDQIEKLAGKGKTFASLIDKTLSSRALLVGTLIILLYELCLGTMESQWMFGAVCIVCLTAIGISYVRSETQITCASLYACGHVNQTKGTFAVGTTTTEGLNQGTVTACVPKA